MDSELPELLKIHEWTPRNILRRAPSIDGLFRPEEQHVAHVKMRLSHQFAAGTAKCATYGFKTGPPFFTSNVNGSPA
jgi:hypothetical protein